MSKIQLQKKKEGKNGWLKVPLKGEEGSDA